MPIPATPKQLKKEAPSSSRKSRSTTKSLAASSTIASGRLEHDPTSIPFPASPCPSSPALAPTPVRPTRASSSRSHLGSHISSSSLSSTSPRQPLPPAEHSLFLLHNALSVTLALHLATHPPVLGPRSSNSLAKDPLGCIEEQIVLKAVANYDGIDGLKETVENGAGRKFSVEDLRRLLWLYEWDGKDTWTASSKRTIVDMDGSSQDDPFVDDHPAPSTSVNSSALASNLLNIGLRPARTLSRSTRSPTHTYTFDLAVSYTPALGGILGAISRWSSKTEDRRAEVNRRLHRWVELCQKEDTSSQDVPEGESSASRNRVRKVPMKVLEDLPVLANTPSRRGSISQKPPSSTLSHSSTAPSTPSTPARYQSIPSTPLRQVLFPPSSPSTSLLSTPLKSLSLVPPSTPTRTPGSTTPAARRQAMADRIAAKSGGGSVPSFAVASSPASGILGAAGFQVVKRGGNLASTPKKGSDGQRIYTADELKRRSTLSRSIGFAESIYM